MGRHVHSSTISYLILILFTNNAPDFVNALSLSDGNGVSRRDALMETAAAGLGVGSIVSSPFLFPDSALAVDGSPIAVLGASGRTGALCVASCLRRGIPVRALTRSGVWPPDGMDLSPSGLTTMVTSSNNNKLLTVSSCNVKDEASLAAGISGCRGVIYAASASKKGGSARDIDNLAVVATGTACLKANIGRYVVISSTAVTRPSSLGFKFTDMMAGGIMGQKRLGELGVMDAYKNNGGSSSSSSSSFTIIRPGGLEEPKLNKILGPSALEVSQGDVLAGIVSRADLAEVAVELALLAASNKNCRNTALELYYTEGAFPCDGPFKKYLDPQNGVVERLHGSTYEELFRGIRPDYDYLVGA
jgi:nucleoside-diphosphate-sugar epimerase